MLENGSWFIAQRPLLLRKWESWITMEKFIMHRILVWVKLRRIPMELFTVDGIHHIASAIGRPLYMDKATKERRRISYARVSIKICPNDELPKTIDVDIDRIGLLEVHVEYP